MLESNLAARRKSGAAAVEVSKPHGGYFVTKAGNRVLSSEWSSAPTKMRFQPECVAENSQV
jgi:hypothetical protein